MEYTSSIHVSLREPNVVFREGTPGPVTSKYAHILLVVSIIRRAFLPLPQLNRLCT
jgi:hypothetical protein